MAADVKIQIEAEHKGFRSAQRAMEGLSSKVTDLGRNVKALIGLEIAEYLIDAAAAAREFAMAGVDASRVSAQFVGDLGALRRASGGAIDDTTLQRLDIMARRTGLASKEIAAFTRLATRLARQEGKELADTFQQLIDASPEQLEKWGVLTSELVEEMKGLDTVQQKAILRQRLVSEGMEITNEEIADGTHALERQGAQWDNFVSSLQESAAAMLDSEGASDALRTVTEDLIGAYNAVSTVVTAWDEMLGKMGETVGVEDVGLASFFKVGWETSVIANIARAEVAYRNFLRYVKEGAITDAAGERVDFILSAQRRMAMGAGMAGALSAGTTKLPEEITFDDEDVDPFTSDPGPRRRRGPSEFDKAIADARAAWFQFRQDRAQAVGEAALEERQRIEEAGLAMFNTLGNGLVDMVATAGSELGVGSWESGIFSTILFGEDPETQLEMMRRFTGELENLSSTWGSFTQGMGAGTDQIRGAIDALSTITAATPELEKANTNLGKGFDKTTQAIGTYASTGIGALSAFTGAFIEDQKTQAGIMAAFEAAQALASWPDPIGIATHTAAAALFGAIAAGAFDGGGGGAARGGAQAGAAFGAPTLADAFDGGGDRETEETTVIQLQVDGRAIGEASLRGANNSASTFRRGERLQANAVGIGRKELF